MNNDYKRWTDDLTVGGRIAARHGNGAFIYGTVIKLGDPRGRWSRRPHYIKIKWDDPRHNEIYPTKFNSSGDEWGSAGRSYRSSYSWSLMHAEQAKVSQKDAEIEKFKQRQRGWLIDKLVPIRDSLRYKIDPVEKAKDLRQIADMLEGEWVGDKPISEAEPPADTSAT